MGRNTVTVIFVGAGLNLAYLYQCMFNNLGTGYKLIGYFEDHVSENLPKNAVRLGNVSDAIQWIQHNHRPHLLFCKLLKFLFSNVYYFPEKTTLPLANITRKLEGGVNP